MRADSDQVPRATVARGTAPSIGPARRARRSRLLRREERVAWLFVAPNLLGFLVFSLLATLSAIGLSFTHWDIVSPPRWAGLGNYQTLVNDPLFWRVLRNTLLFTVASVPPAMVIGLLVAFALHQNLPGKVVLRTLYFMPVVTSMYVIAMVWRWFYNPDFGILNEMLWNLGVQDPPNWLSSQRWALPAIIVLAVWKQCGYNMVLYLAGLAAIPQNLYEAAQIDGASGRQLFRFITLPLLTPVTFFVLIISIIGSFQVFDAVMAMTEGGPANATRTLAVYVYDNAFRYLRMGYASAIAIVLFGLIFVFTAAQWTLQKRWVFYDTPGR